MINKSCLNCVWSGFFIERDDGLYGYEGDCHHQDGMHPPGLHDCIKDDQEELKTVAQPLFEFQANRCGSYEQTGIEKPE